MTGYAAGGDKWPGTNKTYIGSLGCIAMVMIFYLTFVAITFPPPYQGKVSFTRPSKTLQGIELLLGSLIVTIVEAKTK